MDRSIAIGESHPGDTVEAPIPQTVLVEREDELALLSGWVQRAAGGDGLTIALEAAAGVGKSTLLSWVVQLAETAGMAVAQACGGELERDLAYGIVRQLFEARLAVAPRLGVTACEGSSTAAADARPMLEGLFCPTSEGDQPATADAHVAFNARQR